MSDIAIVGMACIFPGAPDLAAYWKNLRAGVDAIEDVPAGRWDPVFYDPASSSPDRFYCKRGGFIDTFARFDAASHGVMPVAARGAEPDQLLTLDVATRALADAGYDTRPFARDRTAVVLGRGNYAGAGRTRLEQHVRTAEQLVTCLRGLLPDLSEMDLARVKSEFQSQIAGIGPDAAIGLVPNLTASRIANRLDLNGPAFTVDAACASSLVAVDHACAELASKRCDLVLAGGVHLCHDEAFWSVFCQLGALSRSQRIRPFDRRADGILIGEGVGVVVLKRLEDAERDDDRIYAVIRGTGVASDGREASLMTPRVEGQLLALERAWSAAGIDRATIGLVEAHGTGTSAGDAAELATLARFFGPADSGAPRAGLGSVKSMIGHAMPAAGIAGLIKTALAVHHGVLLPSIHCEEPARGIDATRFRVVAQEEPWESREAPRRAGVNAFGFGGINAHVVIEQHAAASKPRALAARRAASPSEGSTTASGSEPFALFAADSRDELLALLDERREATGARAHRLAIIAPTPARLARARAIVEKGRPWRGREGIWYSSEGLVTGGGKVAFVFPGLDASFEPRVDDIAERFGLPLPACTVANGIEEIGVGIIGVNRLLYRVLGEIGVASDVMCGHSIGEWSAMIASGMVPEDAVEALIATARTGTLEVPGVVFAAAGCGVEQAERAILGLDRIGVSHDNCPHQVILCGDEGAIDVALARLREASILCQKLPFRSGFHSPLFEGHVGPHRENFSRVPIEAPRAEIWSATSVAPYPSDVSAIRSLALEHLVRPVKFRELIDALYARGVRVFVQVGTGSLANFIEDTLRGRAHLAISANVKERSGLAQLERLAQALFVEGLDPKWDRFGRVAPRDARPGAVLALGAPLVRMKTPLAAPARPRIEGASDGSELGAAFLASMDDILRAQTEVLESFAERARAPRRLGPREATITRTLSIETFPELIDHSFFRQPVGWANVADKHPVVPMTTLLELMIDAAHALVPERKVIGAEGLRASRWLAISTPIDARITSRFDGEARVAVTIDGYCEGTIVLGERYPTPPGADVEPLAGGVPAPHTARELYGDRWMFHGPAFQGIAHMGMVGDDAIRGTIEAGTARGALLDNAGQLFGYWVMIKNDTNRMAMPVMLDRVRFYGPPPSAGEHLDCTVRVRRHGEREVIADISLARGGAVWAAIEGWEDRRFDTDARLWAVMRYPEKNPLAEPRPEGFTLFADKYRSAPTRDQLARRFLGEEERAQYEKLGPRNQRAWLSGRIAAKDAVRDFLWNKGYSAMFPVEIAIHNDASGKPIVRSSGVTLDLRISIAHKEDIAVAIVAEGRDVGIDVEKIEPRSDGFIELSFREEELKILGSGDRDEWLTRMWAAKEAVAKAKGTGLVGDPRRFAIRDRVHERLLVDATWVETRRYGDFVIGWTS
jgi:acyl transferase domain-containing protein/phosphopantetheinyl transferase (holo-ACP synthase)